ncbi:DUF1697 domain-containing protein [Streptomyces sp. HNM0574]|uniref:DUF1697 domain-containing protein n=1 Tax=Streptomyces sp. HNM0574 TaxID=2714954 RepID=UPI00146A02ED|nr:DUF1697 domain-containing protein [Streptomyces sp. HNM0574]NLU65854.1 DUF1697 domain-containing protein [Streptomyces sp. HNM0574]
MTTYVALLRGINVGGSKKVPMAELRQLLTGLGWTGVRTYLQSGNAVFITDDGDPGPLLERTLAAHFGFEVRCLVLTAAELRAVAAACPIPADELDPAKVLVMFLEQAPEPGALDGVDREAHAPEEFRLVDRAVYCHFPDGMGRSKLPDALAAALPGTLMTGRNWRTVRRLIELTS